MRLLPAVVLAFLLRPAQGQVLDYPRDIFNTGEVVTGTKPFAAYDSHRLSELAGKRHELDLQIFDAINEAALRRDQTLMRDLDLYRHQLGYIPGLAAAHYRWVFGDKSQLDWLLVQDRKHGWGSDSLTILVFAYMDEWDKTSVRSRSATPTSSGDKGERPKRFSIAPSRSGNVSTGRSVSIKPGMQPKPNEA